MKTEEKILQSALRLFSEKGYEATKLSEIAEMVGIKAPSLYKHFKNKEEIFSSCVEHFYMKMYKFRNETGLPGKYIEESTGSFFEKTSTEEIKEYALKLFTYYSEDETASSFRKMIAIERYKNEEISKKYGNIFLGEVLSYQEKIFADLIEKGIFIDISPQLLSLKFYSPVLFLLQYADGKPGSMDECRKILSDAVDDFCCRYMVKKNEKR